MMMSVPRLQSPGRAQAHATARGIARRTRAEARKHLLHPGTLVALGVAALACGAAGPFGTGGLLEFGPRVGFWAVMIGVTYAAGVVVSEVVWQARGRDLPSMTAVGLGALAPAVAVPPLVLVVNVVLLGTPYPFDGLAAFIASLVLVCGAVGLLAHLALRDVPVDWSRPVVALARGALAAPGRGHPHDPATRLLDRLPPAARAPIVSLSGEDHYVLVRTLAGEARLLMRLSDAITLVDGLPGMRVHRSHWVARDQVRGVRNDGARVVLAMAKGADIPVSRSNLAMLRRAGLTER